MKKTSIMETIPSSSLHILICACFSFVHTVHLVYFPRRLIRPRQDSLYSQGNSQRPLKFYDSISSQCWITKLSWTGIFLFFGSCPSFGAFLVCHLILSKRGYCKVRTLFMMRTLVTIQLPPRRCLSPSYRGHMFSRNAEKKGIELPSRVIGVSRSASISLWLPPMIRWTVTLNMMNIP